MTRQMTREQMIEVGLNGLRGRSDIHPEQRPSLVANVVDALIAAGCVPPPCATCAGTGFDPECCEGVPIDDPVGMTIDGSLIYHDCDPCPTCGPTRCAACETPLTRGGDVLVCSVCAQDAVRAQDAEIPAAGCVPRKPLFASGKVTLHSGEASDFKIDCDALTDDDIATCARLLAERVGEYGLVTAIPYGGLRLAEAMRVYSTPGSLTELIVDDVLTTGDSMQAKWRELKDVVYGLQGAVLFARGPCPAWVTPLFTLAGCVPPDELTRAALRCDICGELTVGDERVILCAECATPEPTPTHEACPECRGIGRDENANFWCSACHGNGSIPVRAAAPDGQG